MQMIIGNEQPNDIMNKMINLSKIRLLIIFLNFIADSFPIKYENFL